MDVTPPSLLRRLGLALAGLAVAALTGAACALSFDDLRALAITGEARQDLAFLYPAAFDALLVVALIGVLLLRSARLLVRLQAALVLVVLIVAAAAANVATAMRFTFDVRQAAVGVALAPWVMLAVALWLWLLLIKHVQDHRAPEDGEHEEGTAEPDIVPFHPARPAETPPPLVTEAPAPVMESAPLVGPTAAPETPPIPAGEKHVSEREMPVLELETPISEQVAEWRAQEPVPEPTQVQEPVQATQPTQVHEDEAVQAQETGTEPARAEEATAQESVQEPEEPQQEPEPRPAAPEPETRPVRWGDRVKPTDVLVHPRPDERDADTQPHPVFEDDGPDPGHGPEAADDSERQEADRAAEGREDESADTVPHPVIHDDTPAPSGRLRSTPRPPED
ncbi:DUF2637 domain-containing protein [Nonomuraea basaltis]|uniref:DUF2637 domain-containing protein n=1 Tax=Nonomuraea basaltis TaxID=2495887 RepID=UPI00110C4369|nr:DUF2637 domain-containing protein [Nonomuraea basaltis]TMR89888.1 DUF2637 domain-containing protein [Nonomuraea basaltis]